WSSRAVRMLGLDVDRPETFFLTHADLRPAQELEHRDARQHRPEPVLGLEYQFEQLDRSLAESLSDDVELFSQRPGAARDHDRARRNAREDAVEGHDEQSDFQRLLLTPWLNRTRGRRKGERVLLRPLHQAFGHLLVDPI